MTSRQEEEHPSGEASMPKVKAACEECRTRKTKCDAARPTCSRCERKGLACVYETQPDEFRSTALKRKYLELAQRSENNSTLIGLLRDGGRDGALTILDRIRANESATHIVSGSREEAVSGVGELGEQRLTPAMEGDTRSSPLQDVQSTSTATSEGGSATSPLAYLPHPVDRTSIAFLVGANTEPSIAQQSGSETSNREIPKAPSRSSHEDSRRLSLEKRRPVSNTAREASSTGVVMPLATAQPRSYVFSGSSSHVPRAQDQTWMRGLEDVKGGDWDVHYAKDNLFLHILKCYFVWENPTTSYVNEHSFWEGLIAGGSEFCNRTLVHSIMAFGSKISGLFDRKQDSLIEMTALAEATKMWDWNADANVPANISAGLLLHATLTANGHDRDGQPYLDGAMRLAARSGLFSLEKISSCYPSSDQTLSRNRAAFAWGMFAQLGYLALAFHTQLFIIQEPPVPIPEVNMDTDSTPWEPFPLMGILKSSFTSSKAEARARLWRVGNQILPLHRRYNRDRAGRGHWHDAIDLLGQLQSWHENLSGRLSNLHSTAPHVFALHTEYHMCIIDLTRPFGVKAGSSHEDVSSQADSISRESQLQLRLLVHQLELQYSGLPIPLNYLLAPLVSTANETLLMASSGSPMSDEVFYFNLCMKMMRRMAKVSPVVSLIMVGLQQIARRKGVELPQESRELLSNLERRDVASFSVRSDFPLQHDLMITDFARSKLETVVQEIKELRLGRRVSFAQSASHFASDEQGCRS